MRKIKFRGKRIDNGEWVYGAYFCLHHNDDRAHLHHFIIPNNTEIPKDKPIGEIQVEVDPETVGQFIGLKDKNGEEIYEGDIVLCENKTLGVVRYDEFEALYDVGKSPVHYYVYNTRNPEFMKVYIEIMGNIHDNPEILESESDE